MKNKLKLITGVLTLALLGGCATDELKTTFRIDPITGAATWINHKDITAQDVDMSYTNGASHVHIGAITSASNPTAINAQANLNQVTITAQGAAAAQLVNAISAGVGTVAGSTAGSAVKAP